MKRLLSLFDYSGQWSQPFADAGWDVICWDLKLDEMMDIHFLNSAETTLEQFEDVDGILCAIPCTEFAASGSRWWKAKDLRGDTEKALAIAHQALKICDLFTPTDPNYDGTFFYAIENPVGRLARLVGGLGEPYYFNPCDFAEYTNITPVQRNQLNRIRAKNGHGITQREFELILSTNAYTKKTGLWGQFNRNLVTKPIEPVRGAPTGSPMQRLGGKSSKTKEVRSNTPAGFAQAFFEANHNFKFQPMEITKRKPGRLGQGKKEPKKTQTELSNGKLYITGYHGCKCHPFNNWDECIAAEKKKFEPGEVATHRCHNIPVNITKGEGGNYYYSDNFGLVHAQELIKGFVPFADRTIDELKQYIADLKARCSAVPFKWRGISKYWMQYRAEALTAIAVKREGEKKETAASNKIDKYAGRFEILLQPKDFTIAGDITSAGSICDRQQASGVLSYNGKEYVLTGAMSGGNGLGKWETIWGYEVIDIKNYTGTEEPVTYAALNPERGYSYMKITHKKRSLIMLPPEITFKEVKTSTVPAQKKKATASAGADKFLYSKHKYGGKSFQWDASYVEALCLNPSIDIIFESKKERIAVNYAELAGKWYFSTRVIHDVPKMKGSQYAVAAIERSFGNIEAAFQSAIVEIENMGYAWSEEAIKAFDEFKKMHPNPARQKISSIQENHDRHTAILEAATPKPATGPPREKPTAPAADTFQNWSPDRAFVYKEKDIYVDVRVGEPAGKFAYDIVVTIDCTKPKLQRRLCEFEQPCADINNGLIHGLNQAKGFLSSHQDMCKPGLIAEAIAAIHNRLKDLEPKPQAKPVPLGWYEVVSPIELDTVSLIVGTSIKVTEYNTPTDMCRIRFEMKDATIIGHDNLTGAAMHEHTRWFALDGDMSNARLAPNAKRMESLPDITVIPTDNEEVIVISRKSDPPQPEQTAEPGILQPGLYFCDQPYVCFTGGVMPADSDIMLIEHWQDLKICLCEFPTGRRVQMKEVEFTENWKPAPHALHPMPLPTLTKVQSWEDIPEGLTAPEFTSGHHELWLSSPNYNDMRNRLDANKETPNPLLSVEIPEPATAVEDAPPAVNFQTPDSHPSAQKPNAESYPGNKHSAGVPQRLINQLPVHDVFVSGFLGKCAVLSHKRPAAVNYGIDPNLEDVQQYWTGLNRSDIQLFRESFFDWIEKFTFNKTQKDRWVFYLDPTYLFSSRRSGAIIYKNEMSDSDHDRLIAWAITTTETSNVMIAISHYPCPTYDALVEKHGWRKITYQVATHKGVRDECLYMNYPEPTELHDYQFYGDNKITRQAYKRKVTGYIEKFKGLDPVERAGLLRALAAQFNISTPPPFTNENEIAK